MPGFVVKNPEMRNFGPDLFPGFDLPTVSGQKVVDILLFKYSLGSGNRTEIIQISAARGRIHLYPRANFTGTGRDFHKSLEKEYGDVLGHVIPSTIGGPTVAFNIFPSNQSALNEWEDVLLRIVRNKALKMTALCLRFDYEDGHKNRPLYFYYWFYFVVIKTRTVHIKYGRIMNGHQTNLRRETPYVQVIPKFEYKGTQTINISHVLASYREILSGDFFPSNTSFQNVNTRPDIAVANWQRCKSTISLLNVTELKEQDTQLSLINAQIQVMIKNPMVRLFNGKNLTGDSEDCYFGQRSYWRTDYIGCYHVYDLPNVTSAESFGTCIRLFEGEFCEGLSLAIYGRSGNFHQIIDTGLKQVQSVGPCLQDEFINATFMDKIGGHVVKERNSSSHFPDLVQFGGFPRDNQTVFRETKETNIIYNLGPKRRIEYIYIKIHQVDPLEILESVKLEETEYYKSLDKKEGDIPCFAIPLKFHGPANESFNIFPISQSKLEDWKRIFPMSVSDDDDYFLFELELSFVYGSDNSTRPQFVYYYVYVGVIEKIYYVRFNNL